MDVRAKMMASGTGALALRTRRLFLWAVGAGAFVMVASTPHLVAAADLLHITTDGNASSACIGDSRTPRCALDTWEACFIWAEPSLCEKVGVPGMGFPWDHHRRLNITTGEFTAYETSRALAE